MGRVLIVCSIDDSVWKVYEDTTDKQEYVYI